MEDIILWGTGQIANTLMPLINARIILVIDNDKKKWGTDWHGYIVNSPDVLKDFEGKFNRIVIAAEKWKTIRKQIIEEFHIDKELIDNMYFQQKKFLQEKYKKTEDSDIKRYLSYLKKHPLDVFNDDFTSKYLDFDIEVYLDKNNSLYYVYHNGKKMYLSKKFSSEEQVREYYRFLCMEQDMLSPHRYQTSAFHVCQGDVVLDAGVAEGNFALDIIDIVDRIYLVESDRDWIDALKYTFSPYMDKVELIEGFVGNNGVGEISIDSIIGGNKIDFIKMDIEGAEVRALTGAWQTLSRNNVKVDICAYHNVTDELDIKNILNQIGYKTEVSDGYMIFIPDTIYEKEGFELTFARGLVRGIKE